MDVAILGLIIGAAAVAGLARRLGLPAPILLVLAGLAASQVPGVPQYQLDPDVVLFLFLPPLLYSAALDSSYLGVRRNLRPIALLSVGHVLFMTVVVGLVAHALIPGMSLRAALVLGAIVSPPDAIAATAIGRSLGLPRRILTILGGESLLNDATALTAYRVAVAATVSGGFSVLHGAGEFLLASVGGVAIGLAAAAVISIIRQRLDDPLLENSLSLITPFAAYLPAEQAHASGVVAVVVTGLVLGHRSPRLLTYATRLQADAIWRMVDFVLESIVFALIGLQLTVILRALSDQHSGRLVTYAAVILATVIAGRFVWVFPATYLPRLLVPRIQARDPAPSWQAPFVISWAGMRGVVSLAAAFAIPLETDSGAGFPTRTMIIYLTFVVILGTLVVQGLTLPAVIRRLGVQPETHADILAEAEAQHRAAGAALARLDEVLAADAHPPPDGIVERLRDATERRSLGAWERLGGPTGHDSGETPSAAYRRLRRAMLAAEREEIVALRDAGRIDDEVLRRMQHELDLEEALLSRD